MKNLFTASLFCLITSFITAQPNIEWQKQLGGTSSESAYSIIKTSDGGYIAIGGSTSKDGDVSGHHGNDPYASDIWVVKMRPDGSIQWQNSFGGSKSDFAKKIRQTRDGGYVFVGTVTYGDGDVTNFHGDYDYWVVKLDKQGSMQWEKTFGTPGFEIGDDIAQTEDGGYFVVGSQESDFWLLKIDSLGTLLWSQTYGGSSQESAPTMAATSDKGCVIAGWSWSIDGDVTGHHGTKTFGDYWVVKVDSMGTLKWEISLGGSYLEQSESIIQTAEGEYLVTGFSNSNDGDVTGHHGLVGDSKDGWLVKLSNQGQIQWEKSLGGSLGDDISSVYQTADGGFIVAGFTGSTDGDVSGEYHGGGDCWMLKLSKDGTIEWQKLIGGSEYDNVQSCIQTADGGYAFTGSTNSTDGDVLPTGNGQSDYWIVKLSPEMVGTEDIKNLPACNLNIFPNPSSHTISLSVASAESTINVQIMDLMGQQCLHQTIPNGGALDISSFPNGIYSVLAATPTGKVYTNKFIKKE